MASISPGRSKPKDGLNAYRVRWRYRDDEGQLRPDERTVYGMAAARELRTKVEMEFEGAVGQSVSEAKLSERVEQWLRAYGSKPRQRAVGAMVTPTSWDTAEAHLTALEQYLGGDVPFISITSDQLEQAIAERTRLVDGELSDVPVAATTRDRMVGVVKALWSDAVRKGWCRENVAASVPSKWSDPAERSREVIPRVADLRVIAAALDNGRYYRVADPESWRPSDLLWCFALSGMLWSEASGVLRGDVDLANDRIRLARVSPKRTGELRAYGKSGARVPREVPVSKHLAEVLSRLLAYSTSDRLLPGPDGQPARYDWWRHALERACEQASKEAGRAVSYTTYDLRHVAASLWIRSGATKFFVMKAGGWSSMDMVERHYGNLWPGELGQLVDRMDALNLDELD